jgi:GNAT superfamily N-acetyltransferase
MSCQIFNLTTLYPIPSRINRPYFEGLTQETLRHEDIKDIQKYYSKKPASGFWLLEHGDTFVGLIAIDANKSNAKAPKGEVAPPRTALIRHFHVEENYHKANIQDDLLEYAINHAFNKDPTLERIEVVDSPLLPYRRSSLRKAGFELDQHTKTIGVLRWKLGTRYLERNRWIKST